MMRVLRSLPCKSESKKEKRELRSIKVSMLVICNPNSGKDHKISHSLQTKEVLCHSLVGKMPREDSLLKELNKCQTTQV